MPRPVESHHTVATCIAALRANGPMTAPDLAVFVGMQRTSSNWIKALLRRHPDISSRRGAIRTTRGDGPHWKKSEHFLRTEFFAAGEFPEDSPRIADLWRGWRNPATGYQPARLGLDQPESIKGV